MNVPSISRKWRLGALILPAAVCLGAAAPEAKEWRIETVDTAAAGYYTSIKSDSAGNLHAAYVLQLPDHQLKYAFWDKNSKRWFTMRVASGASFCSLVVDSKDRPHISYADWGTGLGDKLWYAVWDGSWKAKPIDVHPGGIIGYYTSLALDRNDKPVLTYYDYADSEKNVILRLGSVFWAENYWAAAVVDRTPGSGKFNTIAIDSAGRPQIAYANVSAETEGLRYATWNGKAWVLEILEGASEPVAAYSVSMVLDKQDVPHIVYTDLSHRWIKYATRRDGKWQIEAVDRFRGAAEGKGYWDRDGIVVDSQGNPYISYFDKGAGLLKVAGRVNGRWEIEIVERNMAGMTSSLAIADGRLWVSYAGLFDQSFKVASRALPDAPRPQSSEQARSVVVEKK